MFILIFFCLIFSLSHHLSYHFLLLDNYEPLNISSNLTHRMNNLISLVQTSDTEFNCPVATIKDPQL